MYLSLDEFYKLGGIYASIHNNGEITEEEVSCLGDIIKSIEDRRRVKNKKNRDNMRRVRNSNIIEEEVENITEVTEEEVLKKLLKKLLKKWLKNLLILKMN